MTTWTEQDSRALTVALVARDGHRMSLRGAERAEALREMAARGLDVATMCDRLRITEGALRRIATYYRVSLAQPGRPGDWTARYIDPRARARSAARRAREKANA